MKTVERPALRLPSLTDTLVTEIVSDEAGLAAVAAEWNALYALCERPSLCASHAWVTSWWRVFGNEALGVGRDTRLFVLLFREAAGALVGAVPFVEDRPAFPWRARRLRILGFVGQNGVFDMTEEPTLLARAGDEARVLALTAEALAPGLRAGRWDAVSFRVHAPAGSSPLQTAFGRLHPLASVRVDARNGSDYAALPESWAIYRKVMTKSMRDNLGYYPRLLTRDGHDWSVRLLREPREMAAAAARLAELHKARAESAKGTRHDAHLQGRVQEAFLAELLTRFAHEEGATVAELVVNGEVVASQAFFERGDTLMVSYSGYREEWYKYSPVFVIDSVVFRDALERGVRRLDFLRNPAPWKSRWLAEPGPPMHRLSMVSRRPEARLRYALFWAGQAFTRNVTSRLPVLARDARTAIGRFVPLAPLLARIVPRVAPTLHWAALQSPLHHR